MVKPVLYTVYPKRNNEELEVINRILLTKKLMKRHAARMSNRSSNSPIVNCKSTLPFLLKKQNFLIFKAKLKSKSYIQFFLTKIITNTQIHKHVHVLWCTNYN